MVIIGSVQKSYTVCLSFRRRLTQSVQDLVWIAAHFLNLNTHKEELSKKKTKKINKMYPTVVCEIMSCLLRSKNYVVKIATAF